MTRRTQCLAAALLLAAAAAPSQQLALQAVLPPGGLAFGQPFELRVERDAAAPFDERLLAPLAVELLARELVDGREHRRYRARCHAVGEVVVGDLVLTVRSSLPEPPGGFEFPGEPRPWPAAPRAGWWLLAALLFGAVVWWVRPRRAAPRRQAPARPPAATALRALRALALPSDQPAAVAAFHAELKRLLRLHVHERFRLPADVRTSEELRLALPPQPELVFCLDACDRVLFGAGSATPAQCEAARAAAIGFAAATAVPATGEAAP